MRATDDIIATAARAEHFGVLLQAIDKSGLTPILSREGPYTLFAPADRCFAEYAEGALEALFADPEEELIPLVLYHVVPGRLRVADLADGLVLESAEGGSLHFGCEGGHVRVNGVRITDGDIEATNGVIHAIAGVLALPAGNWGWDDHEKEPAV